LIFAAARDAVGSEEPTAAGGWHYFDPMKTELFDEMN